MFSAKKALLAGASLLFAAGLAYSVNPSFAEGADAEDFMKLQENLNAPAADEQPTPEATEEASDTAAPVEQIEAPAEVNETADQGAITLEDGTTINANDPRFLEKISALQNAITLKNLELQLQEKTSQLDKLTGAAAAREAEIAAAKQGNTGQFGTAPADDAATLPTVSAIIGLKGKAKAELNLNGGGTITAKAGDMLPGGWELTRIEGSAVYVKSNRTSAEYVLGSASAPDAQMIPAASVATPAPAQPSAQSSGDSDIILAPAN